MAVDLDALVRDIPDFPKPGIVFKDITPVLASPEGLDAAVDGAGRPRARPARRRRHRRRGARLPARAGGRARARRRLRARAQAGQAAARHRARRVRARVRHRRAGAALRRGRRGRARARPRRPAGHGRHGAGAVRARRAARRRGGGLRASSSSSRSSTGARTWRATTSARCCASTPSRCPPHAAAARSPRRLSACGRSWAIRTTCRAGGRASRAWRPSPTSTSPRSCATEDGRSLRADFRVVDSRAPERRAWEQELEGTPFERVFAAASTEVKLLPDGDGTRVTRRRAPAAARLGAPRRLHGAPRDRAGARRGARRPGGACMGREMRWWGWGEDAHAGAVSDAALAWLEGELGALDAPRGAGGARRCAPGRPAAARRAARALRRHPARRPRRARAARARQVLPRPRPPARGRLRRARRTPS